MLSIHGGVRSVDVAPRLRRQEATSRPKMMPNGGSRPAYVGEEDTAAIHTTGRECSQSLMSSSRMPP